MTYILNSDIYPVFWKVHTGKDCSFPWSLTTPGKKGRCVTLCCCQGEGYLNFEATPSIATSLFAPPAGAVIGEDTKN